ncbi:MAG: class I SAM-dependent methyltransferase [Burkholderiales bacterium]|nr:class I SAM-dependent methyltransferase [Burkholderiales bacterium]
MTAPRRLDHRAALEQYRRRAPVYDAELTLFEPLRSRAVAALELAPGATVLDLGCGTGLSLPLLEAALGRDGRIIGVEQCPEMLARARRRAAESGWGNRELICEPVESACLEGQADAALFHFTHDILQSEGALRNVLAHLKPGARVVALGLQWAPPWAVPANVFVLGAALHSVSSLAGLDCPWRGLARLLGDWKVETLWGGSVFLARGRRQ